MKSLLLQTYFPGLEEKEAEEASRQPCDFCGKRVRQLILVRTPVGEARRCPGCSDRFRERSLVDFSFPLTGPSSRGVMGKVGVPGARP